MTVIVVKIYTVTSQVCVEWEAERELEVCVVSAEGLVMVESEDTISLPLPYVLTRLVTPELTSSFTSRIQEAGRCPVWRAVNVFTLENMVSCGAELEAILNLFVSRTIFTTHTWNSMFGISMEPRIMIP